MQLLGETDFNFVGVRRWAYLISLILVAAGIVSLAAHGGLRYGIDFAGGVLLQVRFDNPVTVQEVREAIAPAGFGESEIQLSHDIQTSQHPEMLIRAPHQEGVENPGNVIRDSLHAVYGDTFEIRREELVGPKIGQELRRNAVWAICFSLLGILIYMSWRFEYRSGVAAIVALFHDVIITVGAISLTGREMSLPVLAALLTLVGYSLNDTIVVFDRVREERRLFHRLPFDRVVNGSINHTLSRTIITSGTTLMVVLFLFILGGEVIHDFAFVLLVGVLVGTYSSVFVASPIVVEWEGRRSRRGGGTPAPGRGPERTKERTRGRHRKEAATARV